MAQSRPARSRRVEGGRLKPARILELARQYEAYPRSIEPTLRGAEAIVEFAQALLAEHVAEQQDAGEQPKAAA